MERTSPKRFGVTIIEMLICITIAAMLIGLTLSAVQKVRIAGLLLQSKNNLRQVALGFHTLAESSGDKIRDLPQAVQPKKSVFSENNVFHQLLPWVHGPQPAYDPTWSWQQALEVSQPANVRVYMSPADPTLEPPTHLTSAPLRGRCSYAYNMMACDTIVSFPVAITDGTSNTLAFAESYHLCGWGRLNQPGQVSYARIYYEVRSYENDKSSVSKERRPTFADVGWNDVMPTADGVGRSVASVPGLTFQYRPTMQDADARVPQTPHPAGLPVALFDGSVRTLSPGIDESVFWGLVTPAGGEVVSLD